MGNEEEAAEGHEKTHVIKMEVGDSEMVDQVVDIIKSLPDLGKWADSGASHRGFKMKAVARTCRSWSSATRGGLEAGTNTTLLFELPEDMMVIGPAPILRLE